MRQVGLRRQICPQICIPQHGQWQLARLAYRLAEGNSMPADRLRCQRGVVAYRQFLPKVWRNFRLDTKAGNSLELTVSSEISSFSLLSVMAMHSRQAMIIPLFISFPPGDLIMSGHRWISLLLIAFAFPATGCQMDGGKASLWNPFVRAEKADATDEATLPKFVRRLSDDDKEKSEKPDVPIAESRVEALLADGQRALQENRIADAQKSYREVLQFLPDNATAHHGLAMAADLTEQWSEAENHYRQALRTRPRDANLVCDIGYSYLLQNRYSEASSYLSQAVQINPNHENAHTNLAMLDLRQGNREAARERILQRFGNTAKATQMLAALESQTGTKAASLVKSGPEIPANASYEQIRELARQERIAAEQRRAGLTVPVGFSEDSHKSGQLATPGIGPGNVSPAIHQPDPQSAQFSGSITAPAWNAETPTGIASAAQPVGQSAQPGSVNNLSGFSPPLTSNSNYGSVNPGSAGAAYNGNSMPGSNLSANPGANPAFGAANQPAAAANNMPSASAASVPGFGGVIPVRPSGSFQPPAQGVSYGQPMGFGQPPVETASYQNQSAGPPVGNAAYGNTSGSQQVNLPAQQYQNAGQNFSNLQLEGLNAGPGALFPIGQPPMSGVQPSVGPQDGSVRMGNVSAPGTNSVINGAMYGQPVSTLPSQEWMMQQQQQIQQLQQQQPQYAGQGHSYPGPNGIDPAGSQYGNANATTAPRPGVPAQPTNPLASYENQLRQLDNQYNSTLQQMDRNATATVPRAQY